MKGAGIDTSIFKALSCRGAAASAAKDHGVAVADIMKTADWSRETTFTRYYYRADKENYLGQSFGTEEGTCYNVLYYFEHTPVADLGGGKGAPPLVARYVNNCTSPSNDYTAVECNNNNQAQLHTHVSVPY